MINSFYFVNYKIINHFKNYCKRMASCHRFILNFDNQSLKQLPTDEKIDNSVRNVKGYCFVRVTPTPVINPKLVASSSALNLLGISDKEINDPVFVEYFAGNKIMLGSEPAAHCYCGHQFGYFAGQLGDGAAIYLGEVINSNKERWEVQLKGAGLTPFSRTADGRKVLRSSIREFLCSEAMYHLGVPTTRAGTCITSDSLVIRDIFYNGNPIREQCTIVSRIAPTFIRFGSFEIAKGADRFTGSYGPSVSQPNIVQTLTNFVIKSYFPQIWTDEESMRSTMYVNFFSEVVHLTARLVSKWQCVGFCHGVLNTDNMSIIGLTIDYGPYGFLDRYDPEHICNASDNSGRYMFKKQPEICKWNLRKLSEALQLFVPMNEMMKELEKFDAEYEKCYLSGMRAKLGLVLEDPIDKDLIETLLTTMHITGADYTNSFRCLSQFNMDNMKAVLDLLLKECCDVKTITEAFRPKIDEEMLSLIVGLGRREPRMAEKAQQLQQLVDDNAQNRNYYEEYKDMSDEDKRGKDISQWNSWLQKYKNRLAKEFPHMQKQKKSLMDRNNPKFILRNHLLQEAIQNADKGDFNFVELLLKLLQNPYDDIQINEDYSNIPSNSFSLFSRPPDEMAPILVT